MIQIPETMSDNQIDSYKRQPGSIAHFIKRNLLSIITLLGVFSAIFIFEYYPLIIETGNRIFLFCDKCWTIFNEII